MMEPKMETKPKAIDINKPAYALFLLAGIYFLIQKNFSEAVIFWGLALVFDPFNTTIPFQKRPVYQQLWLIVHLSVTLALFVLDITKK
jgi:hypothetical protein